MFLYRDHRGGLAESMETVQKMNTLGDIQQHLKEHIEPILGPGEITVDKYYEDKRIDWDTHIVCHNGHPVGFTDGPVLTK